MEETNVSNNGLNETAADKKISWDEKYGRKKGSKKKGKPVIILL